MNITVIDIDTFTGSIPAYSDLIIFEQGQPELALALNGFDEVGLFDHQFANPTYGFTAPRTPVAS